MQWNRESLKLFLSTYQSMNVLQLYVMFNKSVDMAVVRLLLISYKYGTFTGSVFSLYCISLLSG